MRHYLLTSEQENFTLSLSIPVTLTLTLPIPLSYYTYKLEQHSEFTPCECKEFTTEPCSALE